MPTVRFLSLVLVAAMGLPIPAEARSSAGNDCLARLDELAVSYRPAGPLQGVREPVEVTGPLGGVEYRAFGRARPLVLDCSLVYSLALAGRYFVDEGIRVALFSDSYHRRFVRGTDRWSKHSFGLALDVHVFEAPLGKITVEKDYQRGLGRGKDCVGHPSDARARSLRMIWCRMSRSELFRMVLDPDFDADHRNHFHIQAPAWEERSDLAWR